MIQGTSEDAAQRICIFTLFIYLFIPLFI